MVILISSYYLHIRLGTLLLIFNSLVLGSSIMSHIYAKLLQKVFAYIFGISLKENT
jgi:hypothetical protein